MRLKIYTVNLMEAYKTAKIRSRNKFPTSCVDFSPLTSKRYVDVGEKVQAACTIHPIKQWETLTNNIPWWKPISFTSFPHIRPRESSWFVHFQAKCRYLASHRLPSHLNCIILSWWVLKFEVMRNLLQSSPHSGPLILSYTSDEVYQESFSLGINRAQKDAEFWVV